MEKNDKLYNLMKKRAEDDPVILVILNAIDSLIEGAEQNRQVHENMKATLRDMAEKLDAIAPDLVLVEIETYPGNQLFTDPRDSKVEFFEGERILFPPRCHNER